MEQIVANQAETRRAKSSASGLFTYLKDLDNLKAISFLSDLMLIFQRLQKRLQSNSLTLISMETYVKSTTLSLEKLKTEYIPSAHESVLRESIVIAGDKKYLKNILLKEEAPNSSRRSKHDLVKFRTDVCDWISSHSDGQKFRFN